MLSQDFAGLGGDVALSAHAAQRAPNTGTSSAISSSRCSVEGGYIHSFEDGDADRRSGPAHRPLLPRQPADPRLRHSRRRPARPAHALSRTTRDRRPASPTNVRRCQRRSATRSSTTRSAAALIISARAELEIPLGAGVRELGLRPSVFVDVGALWGVRTPALIDIDPNNPLALQRSARARPAARSRLRRDRLRPAAAETLTRVADRAVPRDLPRRFAEPAPFGRLRRQLELAVRSVPDRHRPRLAQRAGRRHQALHFQRRDCILMNKLTLRRGRRRARLAAADRRPGAAAAAGGGRRRQHRPDRPAPAPPCAAANTQLQAQGHAAPGSARSSSASRSRPRSRRSRPRSTRCRRAAARRGARRADPDLPDQPAERRSARSSARQEHDPAQRRIRSPADRPAHAAGDRPGRCSSAARPSCIDRGATLGAAARRSTSPPRCWRIVNQNTTPLNVNAPPPQQPPAAAPAAAAAAAEPPRPQGR